MCKQKVAAFLCASISIFAYQTLLGPTFSTLLVGLWQSWVGVPSFLGIGFGMVSVVALCKSPQLEKLEHLSYWAVFASYFLVFGIFHFSENIIDLEILRVGQILRPHVIEQILGPVAHGFVWPLLLIAALPFLSFGSLLGTQFCRPHALTAYKYEVIGILVGSFLCVALLEAYSWNAAVLCTVGLALISGLLGAAEGSVLRFVLAIVAFASFVFLPSFWNLQRDLHLVARDFGHRAQIREIAHRWKSFAKVQLLEASRMATHRKFIAIGDGSGLANIFPYDSQFSQVSPLATVKMATLYKPEKILVLFAGAGAELLGIHQALGHHVESWGVEINSAINDLMLQDASLQLGEFFHSYPTHYVVSDNRRFLESTSEKFDSIIYSWSGATVANFSGAILHTTQYSFTIEAVRAALAHLRENGIWVVMGGNKMNLLTALKELEETGEISNLSQKILLFDTLDPSPWQATWDDQILVYRNGPWSSEQIKAMSKSITPQYRLALRPGEAVRVQFTRHLKLLESRDPKGFARSLWKQEHVYPQIARDDIPFAYRNTPAVSEPLAFFACGSWALFLLGWFFYFRRRHPKATQLDYQFLAWAPLGAFCFLFFLYKAILVLGQPTWAFLLVQGCTQLGTLAGLSAARYRKNNTWNLWVLGSTIAGGLAMVFAFNEPAVVSWLFNVGLLAGGAILGFIISALAMGLAYYFIGCVADLKDGRRLGGLWAVEILLTGVASLLGTVMIEKVGISEFAVVAGLTALGMFSPYLKNRTSFMIN